MPDIVTSKIFVDGERGITATKLNQIQSLAVIQPDFVGTKPSASSVASTDQLLVLNSSNNYVRAPFSTLSTSVAGLLPLADNTQNGMLRQLSGNTTDFVDGTNHCQSFASAVSGIIPVVTYGASGLAPGFNQRLQIRDNFAFAFNGTVALSGTLVSNWPIGWWLQGSAAAGSGVTVSPPATSGSDIYNKCYGVWNLGSGSANGNYQLLSGDFIQTVAGLGQLDAYFRIAFARIASATNVFTYQFGFADSNGPSAQNVAMVSVGWNSGLNANAWTCTTAKAGLTSLTTATPTPSIAAFNSTLFTYYNCRISINAAWNSVTFYVNNTLIGTLTTNIPATGTLLTPYFYVGMGTPGNQQAVLLIDDYMLDYQYAMP